MISGHVSIFYGFKGPNLAIVTACTTGLHCIGEAGRMIEYGDADVMVAGGAESTVSPLGIGGFAAARALSTRNDDPATASRPWDKDRDGFVLGEGAGVLVLEEYEHAKKRGAKIYAELVGFGMGADAIHMTAPNVDGPQARDEGRAAQRRRRTPTQVQYLNAHGTSHAAGRPERDQRHQAGLRRPCASKLVVNSTKSMTGHLLGGAGGIESVFTVLALHHQVSPPTINIFNQDPECDLDYCANDGARDEDRRRRRRTISASAAPTARWCSAAPERERCDAMHAAPPVRVSLAPERAAWAAVRRRCAAVAAANLVAWLGCMLHGSRGAGRSRPAWSRRSPLAVVLALARRRARSQRRPGLGRQRLALAHGRDAPVGRTVRACSTSARWMLLRFDLRAGRCRRHWIAAVARRATAGPAWPALRAALYSRRPAAADAPAA